PAVASYLLPIGESMAFKDGDVLRGTLDLMILRTLELRPMHGYGIAQRLAQITSGEFGVSPGSLFPALHRLEGPGLLCGSWGTSENGRRARFYELTKAGQRRLGIEKRAWDRITLAVRKVLQADS